MRLLRAAVELFASEGYAGTTTPRIAGHAGVAEGTIYRHFPDKRQLFNEAYQSVQRWSREVWQENGPRHPLRDRLARIARQLAEAAWKDPAATRMLLAEWPADLLNAVSQEASREVREILDRLIASGKQDGHVRPGPAELWASVWLALVAAGVRRVASREWGADHPHFALVVEAAWAAIAAAEERGAPGP